MWRTPEGDRVLHGAEWKLFRRGLSELWGLVENSAPNSLVGVRTFDELQTNQKLAMLALVGQALASKRTRPMELTACSEGTVAAVFQYLRQSVDEERNLPDQPRLPNSWRELVRAACDEVDITGTEVSDKGNPEDQPDWDDLVESLAQRVLWDTDYAKGNGFLDTDPEVSRANRKTFGISDNYFVAIAPDPTDSQLDNVRSALQRLTRHAKGQRKRPNSNRFRRDRRFPG